MIECPACSERAPDGSRFCPRCGSALSHESVDPTRTSIRHAAPARSTSAPFDEGRFLPGTVLVGRYRIHGLLGRGGMSRVYKVEIPQSELATMRSLKGVSEVVARYVGP